MQKEKQPWCCAVVPAAGNSSRMGLTISKQLISLLGVPVLIHTLLALEKAQRIHEIILVVRKEDQPAIQQQVERFSLQKLSAFVEGGATRQQSVEAGAAMAAPQTQYLAIHDGARPLVSSHMIDRVVEDAIQYRAAVLGVPVKDTIKTVDPQGFVQDTPDRSILWAVQTPQVFERELYLSALSQAKSQGKEYTDDCQLVEAMQVRPHICRGEYSNLKLTTQEDILFAEALLADAIKPSCGEADTVEEKRHPTYRKDEQ